jgi:hypothetical protein
MLLKPDKYLWARKWDSGIALPARSARHAGASLSRPTQVRATLSTQCSWTILATLKSSEASSEVASPRTPPFEPPQTNSTDAPSSCKAKHKQADCDHSHRNSLTETGLSRHGNQTSYFNTLDMASMMC